MKLTWGQGNDNIKFEGSKFVVNSDDVVIFNIIGDGNNKLNTNLSTLENEILNQVTSNIDGKLEDLIEVDKTKYKKYKTAMVDGGVLKIDKNIYQDENKTQDETEKKLGEFYFKRFLGTKLQTTVTDNVKINAEITTEKSNEDYNGKVTGLEIVSSKTAQKADDASITLNKGAEIAVNRIEKKADTKPNENHASVGIFTNYAKADMLDGSKITVEKTAAGNENIDSSADGVGIFAVNGSEINVGKNYNENVEAENAKIEVFGDKAVGVYAKASREENKDGKITAFNDEYGNQAGQGLINVTNNGIIDVSHGLGTVGISAYNNYSGDDQTGHGAENNRVSNTGFIKVGTSDKNNTSVGIYGNKVTISNSGKIEIGNGEKEKPSDNFVKYHGGVGIFAANGSVVEKIGGLVLGDYGTGVIVDATSEITDTEALNFVKNPNSQQTSENEKIIHKIGIAYNNAGRQQDRVHKFDITASENISGLRAIASLGGNLIVEKEKEAEKGIVIGDNDNRGIIVSDGNLTNNRTITISDSQKDLNSITSSIAIGASGKNSVITNNGAINLNGKKSIGIFVKNDYNTESIGNKIQSTGTINLNGNENTGVYIQQNIRNNGGKNPADVETYNLKDLADGIKFGENSKNSTAVHVYGSDITAAKENEKISRTLENSNVLLKATNGSNVLNNGEVEIISTIKDNKVIGIVLDEDSTYKGNGKITVKGGAIGLYSKAGAEKEFNNLKLDLVSQEKNAVGFAIKRNQGENNSKIYIKGNTDINLLSPSQNMQTEQNPNEQKPNQDETSNKGVGILAKDTDLFFDTVNLKYDGTQGIGIYLKDNASIKRDEKQNNKLNITGTAGKEYSTGIYANADSGTVDTTKRDIDIDIDIDKSKAIGIFNDKENLIYHGAINVNKEDSLGIFNDNNKKIVVQNGSNINVTGKAGEGNASIGISSKNGSTVTVENGVAITTNGERDAGIYGENTAVTSSGKITVNGGTGVFLTGANSSFDGEKGTIETKEDDKSQTAIHLSDGAKITNNVGEIKLHSGDIGIFADHTVIDGSKFASKDEPKDKTEDKPKRGKLEINHSGEIGKDKAGMIGIASENSEIKNLDISFDNKALGIFGLNGKLNAENISITSGYGNDTTIGIYLGKKSDGSVQKDNTVSNAEIKLENGYGIIMQDSDAGRGNTLTVSNSDFIIKNHLEDKNSAAMVAGKNNTLVLDGNNLYVGQNIGIHGAEGSTLKLVNKNRISLFGKSTGIYSDRGTVEISKETQFIGASKDDVKGGAVYVKDGKITSGAEIGGIFSKFYGLGVEGKGSITNTGYIHIGGENSIGIYLNGKPSDTDNKIINSGNVIMEGTEKGTSVAIYGKHTNIENSGVLQLKNYALGLFYDNTETPENSKDIHKDYTVKSTGDIKITGSNAVGALLKGNAKDIHIKNIVEEKSEVTVLPDGQVQSTGNNMGIYASNLTADNFTVDNISLKDNSFGMYLNKLNGKDGNKMTVNIGSISVGDGVGSTNEKTNSSIALGILDGKVDLNIKDKISAGENGTAILNQNGNVTISDITKLSVGAGHGSLVHSNGGNVTLKDTGAESYNINIDGHYGFILENGGKISGDENFKKKELTLDVKNGGTGIIFSETKGNTADKDRAFSDLGVNKIVLTGGIDDKAPYTKGVYYKDLGEINEDLTDLVMTQSGKNTAGLVLNGTYGVIKTGDILLGKEAQYSAAVIVKGNEGNVNDTTTITGNLTVHDSNKIESGNENKQQFGNIGLEAHSSSVSTDGNIIVGEGISFENRYPVGVYAVNENTSKDQNLESNNYMYTGNGDLTVGNFASGIVSKNYNVLYNGNITAGVGAIGILADNGKYVEGSHYTTVTKNITVGDESLKDRIKGIGISGKNTDITVGFKNELVDMKIKSNKENIGILSFEKGNIEFNGNVDIAGNKEIERGKDSAVGIYKNGSGKVEINKGSWTVGENSFGVIANSIIEDKNKDGKVTNVRRGEISLVNESDMTVKKGSVGIYSTGENTVSNKGDISLNGGAENSTVGIYMQNDGSKTSVGTNSGVITADGKNSVGVQAVGNIQFTNEKDGVINVLNGGIGMYAVNGAEIKNDGTINLGDKDGKDSTGSIGMYGQGKGTKIINNGVINANHGTGMYVEEGAELYNYKDINIKNGIGIKGNGTLLNTGNINLEKGFSGIIEDTNSGSGASIDTIINIQNDVAVIGPNYTGLGGNINSDYSLKLENPTIDITSGELGFNAPDISGGITAAPNFAGTGNGYDFDIKDFAKDDVNLDVNTSPLFDGKIENGDLSMNKVDYKGIMKDYQYKEFYNALDTTLRNGAAEDIDALKNLNTYLESLGKGPEFYEQYSKTMGESRGSIYSHIQSRMQDIERNFNNAFEEMESSYSLSKDTDKFSVIYTNGDYKNHRNDIPNYDYRITGLLYMKEYESVNARDKYGYSYGFTGSRFKFDDTGNSKEDIYSLKGGIHNVKYFDKDLNLLTKLEAGINYHETERKLAFGNSRYENDSDFWSYHVSFDNKFRKTLYEDYQNEFGAYLGFETEYGRFTDIKEDGTLALKVKGNDYLSAKGVAGFNGTGRKYLGKDWTGKITGDLGYSYDFGKNYKENKSKLKRTDSDYISLMSEVETKGKVLGKIGIGVERLNHMGVTLEGEAGKDFERDEDYWRIGLRFNYKFNSEDAETTLRNTFNLFINHFDFDKDNLKEREQEIAKAGSRIIDKYNLKGTLVLEGHTDSKGSVEYNQGLSERRAETVKKELKTHIKSENIKYQTKGYSELRPVDTNETKEGRANNRRTEVKYISDKKR